MASTNSSDEYLPPLILGGIIGLCYIISVGANDVANALGTSVGSGAISLRTAIVLGGISELLGATLVGGKTSSSLGEKFLTIDQFTTVQYSYAMFAALFGSACWNSLATYFSLPVSSTHAIIGSLVFIGIAQDGVYSVNWVEVGLTALSWVLSPLAGFIISYSVYYFLDKQIISKSSSFKLAAIVSPYLNAITIATLGLFIFMAGPKAIRIENGWGLFGLFVLLGLVSFLLFNKLILPYMEKNNYINNGISYSGVLNDGGGSISSSSGGFETMNPVNDHSSKMVSLVENDGNKNFMIEALSPSSSTTTTTTMETASTILPSITNGSTNTRRKNSSSPAENYFVLPMIMTACCVAFAHGGNDVGNAIGPFSASLHIYIYGSMDGDAETPVIVTFCGGIGIVIGLAAFGKRVMETVGKKITKLTFSKGFAAQYGASLAVLICTALGLPISTTSVLIGSIAGVGSADGEKNSIDFQVIKKIILGWLATLPAAGIVAMIIYAICKALL